MKFSIIIPVYNVAPYLRECLDSVCAAAAKVEDAEIICVDDGSTDGSGKIIDEFVRRSTATPSTYTFKSLRQQNRGEGEARNAALKVAQGEWLCFLDGDDLFTPEMLQEGAKLIAENPECDIVQVALATFIDGDDRRSMVPRRVGLMTGGFCTGFYRRSKFGAERFANFLVGADRVYAATCAFQTGRIATSQTVGYLYRQRATSISHVRMTPRKAQDSFLHVAEMLKLAASCGRKLEPTFRRVLAAQILEEGAANCRQLAAADRREVERHWYACIRELRALGVLTPWGNFVAWTLRLLPLRMTRLVLCELPYRLKKAGLHR